MQDVHLHAIVDCIHSIMQAWYNITAPGSYTLDYTGRRMRVLSWLGGTLQSGQDLRWEDGSPTTYAVRVASFILGVTCKGGVM